MTLASLYPFMKQAHIGLVITSVVLFAIRGGSVLVGARWPMRSGVRHLSYGIDIGLLTAALLLLAVLQANPFTTPWLATKLALLVVYIVLGSMALKRARSQPGRLVAFAAALLCFAAMYTIARRHNPLGFLAWF